MKKARHFRLLGRFPFLPLFLFNLILLCFAGDGQEPASIKKTAHPPTKQPLVNAAIARYEPALAIRASACITCHAKIQPGYITDFGYGDRYFFGKPGGGTTFGPFDGNVYGDFYGGEPDKTGWLTADIGKEIVVPQAALDSSLSAAGTKLSGLYQQPLQAKSLAEYLQALENQKKKPATVIEKKTVFIGAPNAATLEARFDIAPGSTVNFKYIKNGSTSPDLRGIGLSSSKDFYTNTGEVECDGDLFIRGTLFLNHPIITRNSGCRIYATGPIFVQKAITYKDLDGTRDKTNLQLVSAEAILLGVGDKSCDATAKDSPLSRRLVSGYAISSFFTRDATSKSISPKTFGQSIYDQGKRIAALEDAGCENDTISFTRLLLNAPQVHSRYKGNFKGLVIAEFGLFRLSKSSFEFDPVFKEVTILPRLKDSDYLQVQ